MRGAEETTRQTLEPNGRLRLGNLEIDLDSFRVSVEGQPVHLTRLEFDLLCELAANADRVLSLDALAQFLWSTRGRRESRRLSVMVFRLREKLQGSAPYQITTVRRRGYGLLIGKRDPP